VRQGDLQPIRYTGETDNEPKTDLKTLKQVGKLAITLLDRSCHVLTKYDPRHSKVPSLALFELAPESI
jgi:hypothetical protein